MHVQNHNNVVTSSQCPQRIGLTAFLTRGVHRTHTPHWTSTGQDACYNRRDISADAHRTVQLSRILCSCMAISKVWEWPLTAYYIVKLERWGQMLRIIGNSWKKNSRNNSHNMSVKYINRGKVKYSETERLDFSQVHLEQFLLFAIVWLHFNGLWGSMWRDFNFFAWQTDRQTTDGQTKPIA